MPQGQQGIDYAALAKEFGGTPAVSHDQPVPKTKSSTRFNPIEQQMGGAIGAGKAVGRTVVNIADLVNWLASKPFGAADWQNTADQSFDTARTALTPSNPSQRMGATGADVGMAMLAGGPATSLARGAASMAPRALAIPVRMAVDALTSAGIAKAEGQSATVPAITGGLMGGAMGIMDDAAMAARLARGVENRQVSALAPPGRGTAARKAQEQIRQVGPQLAREPGMGGWSRGTVLTKVTDAMDEAGNAMDTAAAQVSKTKTYDTNSIYKTIQRLRNEITAKGVVAEPARDAALASMQAQVKALGPDAPYSAIAKLRKGWQKAAASGNVFAQDAAGVALKDAARAQADVASILVDTLAKGEPAMQAANSRWSFLKKAKDAMTLAQEMDQSSPKALRGVIARTGGAMTGTAASGGSLGGMTLGYIIGGAVERAMHAGPTTQIMTARALARFEDALKAGKWADVETALTALRLAGQASMNRSGS